MSDFAINQQITEDFFSSLGIELFIKREDLLHPYISGNKFRKLKYNLQSAKNSGFKTLLTFGGAYSNHIHATAYAGKKYNFKTIGLIRGEELGKNISNTLSENTTLAFAKKMGMELHFISREAYKQKTSPSFIQNLKSKFGDFYLLPEGGTNALAIKGCSEILSLEDKSFDFVCSAVGTGGTISGIIESSINSQKIIGFPVLKENYLHTEIEKNTTKTNWTLHRKYHCNGYAKITDELIHFINNFQRKHHIPLDPIYTGKLLFGIFNEIRNETFPKNCRILAIHTGGLQGIEGINSKLKKQGKTIINTLHEV